MASCERSDAQFAIQSHLKPFAVDCCVSLCGGTLCCLFRAGGLVGVRDGGPDRRSGGWEVWMDSLVKLKKDVAARLLGEDPR